MIIYPLPPEELDDKTLDKQIKAIREVLVGIVLNSKGEVNPYSPEGMKLTKCPYRLWARTCLANYKNLVERGHEACQEWHFRFSDKCTADMQSWEEQYDCGAHHKMKPVIEWARDNTPEDFPRGDILQIPTGDWVELSTNFPIVMPEKYIVYKREMQFSGAHIDEPDIDQSYRNYYRAKLPKDAKFTRREKPEWLND